MVLLDKDKLYALLVNINYSKEGKLNGISPMKSLFVTGNSKFNLIAVNIINGLNKVINQYNLDRDDCIVSLHCRDCADKDLDKLVEPETEML